MTITAATRYDGDGLYMLNVRKLACGGQYIERYCDPKVVHKKRKRCAQAGFHYGDWVTVPYTDNGRTIECPALYWFASWDAGRAWVVGMVVFNDKAKERRMNSLQSSRWRYEKLGRVGKVHELNVEIARLRVTPSPTPLAVKVSKIKRGIGAWNMEDLPAPPQWMRPV